MSFLISTLIGSIDVLLLYHISCLASTKFWNLYRTQITYIECHRNAFNKRYFVFIPTLSLWGYHPVCSWMLLFACATGRIVHILINLLPPLPLNCLINFIFMYMCYKGSFTIKTELYSFCLSLRQKYESFHSQSANSNENNF